MRATALAVALSLCACATTERTGLAKPSGFLGDYSRLSGGGEEQAALVYIEPGADFARYHSVLVEPVVAWKGGDSQLQDVPREELFGLVNHLDAALREQLAIPFKVVERPGPGVLRLRTAITEARASPVVLDIASTVLPPARLLSAAKKLATGTEAFVGRAAIEVEILDGLTGERLVAAVDERAGTKTLSGAARTWGDVEAAFDDWARVIAQRLATLRALDATLE